MKKNKFLKLASGLLVLCLLTTCVISTTFAKYTTSGSANDTARVAKWGVEVAVQAGDVDKSETNAFYDEYKNGTKTTVKGSQEVVAPGTSGTLVSFSVSGTPEVALSIAFDVTKQCILLILRLLICPIPSNLIHTIVRKVSIYCNIRISGS